MESQDPDTSHSYDSEVATRLEGEMLPLEAWAPTRVMLLGEEEEKGEEEKE